LVRLASHGFCAEKPRNILLGPSFLAAFNAQQTMEQYADCAQSLLTINQLKSVYSRSVMTG
jgi:hypothetical protein